MEYSKPIVQRQKSIIVSSRFRQNHSQSRLYLDGSVSKKQVLPQSSSPRHEDQKKSFSIHDSVASMIRPEANSQLRDFSSNSYSLIENTLRHAVSVPDIASEEKDSKLRSRLLNEDNSVLRKHIFMDLLAWKVLEKHAKEVLEKVIKTEEKKNKMQLDELKNLENVISKKRKIKKWMSSWLAAQNSIDTQIDILHRLDEVLRGKHTIGDSSSSGLLYLLQFMQESLLEKLSHWLPTHGIICSPQKLASAVSTARSTQASFCEEVEPELVGLRQLADQLESIKNSSVNMEGYDAGLMARLAEAGYLCTHLASLRAHKIQLAKDPNNL